MRIKINRKQERKSNLMSMLNGIERFLIKLFVIFILLLLIFQIMLYHKVGSGYLNSVYKMEGNIYSFKSKPIYDILCIYGKVSEYDNIWVMKNGISINQITSDKPVYIYIFEGDIIEIDATRASGISHEIFIKNITSNFIPEGFFAKITLTDKLYRFQPFYNTQ